MKGTRRFSWRPLRAGMCAIFLAAVALVLLLPAEGAAQLPQSQRHMLEEYWLTAFPGQPPLGGAKSTAHMLAKAVPDECYNGIGVVYPPGPPCAEGKP